MNEAAEHVLPSRVIPGVLREKTQVMEGLAISVKQSSLWEQRKCETAATKILEGTQLSQGTQGTGE